ncbi:MAG TPA: alpha/beta fold hydrolase [Thermoanaerobaculia bacterium]|nr:alpha/beta fold hydrolase [Thermoanaerobaculia bacterium]
MRTIVLAFLLATSALAADEHDFVVRNFHFHDGATLPEVRVHYVTIGTPGNDNAVLVLHGTGGSSKQFLNDRFAGVLFKPGGVLDTSRYFIIIPDNIGAGQSTKPSDGLGRNFPHYDYDDMIELQHELVSSLGIHHLFLVMGTSMGGMHTWMWGERWPDEMDALVPLASAPTEIAGRNRVWRKMMIDDFNRGDVEGAVQILMLVGSAPLQYQREMPTRGDADRWLAEQMKTRVASMNPVDELYALEASRDYDPSSNLEKIKAPLLAINSADDFINPPELGILDRLIKRVPHGQYLLIPTSEQTHGHSTHTWAAVWEGALRKFLGSAGF